MFPFRMLLKFNYAKRRDIFSYSIVMLSSIALIFIAMRL